VGGSQSRWRLALWALIPVVLVAIGKTVVTELDSETIELNPLYTGLVAGNIFLLGFLLAGTLSDYKEAEKLPVELAASLESIGDEFSSVRAAGGEREGAAALAHLRSIVTEALDWLRTGGSVDAVLQRVFELGEHYRAIAPHTEVAFISRIKAEQSNARRMIMRIGSIRDTSFVLAGFIVAALTSAVLLTVLLFIDVGPLATDLVLMCALTFLLSYLLLLIRDLDNPFDYVGSLGAGSVEASLVPLAELETRLESRIAEAPVSSPASVRGRFARLSGSRS
jgi:hypothetical protein